MTDKKAEIVGFYEQKVFTLENVCSLMYRLRELMKEHVDSDGRIPLDLMEHYTSMMEGYAYSVASGQGLTEFFDEYGG
jgi:hypothetical protein